VLDGKAPHRGPLASARAASAAPVARTAPAGTTTELPTPDLVGVSDAPWVTIVWNDPVNLMSYVTLVFQRLLGHPRPKAESLMLDVHRKGRATVSAGTREQMEADVTKLQSAGLWATLAQDK
jgi:ATP-dependent Clp protease adaptor protein ClpS